MANKSDEGNGLDIAGFGKIAKAIPPKVYERSASALIKTFEQLVAPITESTSGFGRYIRQKFDNMVDAEKAIATYTVEKAFARARTRAAKTGKPLAPPAHLKSFVRCIEEASKETDPLMHEMWTNLLATQLVEDKSHPHFVEILPHFSPLEAKLLVSLLPRSAVGENSGRYLFSSLDCFTHWMPKNNGALNPWTISCEMLCEFRFADLLAPKGNVNQYAAILHRTETGAAFLSAVTAPPTNKSVSGEEHDAV